MYLAPIFQFVRFTYHCFRDKLKSLSRLSHSNNAAFSFLRPSQKRWQKVIIFLTLATRNKLLNGADKSQTKRNQRDGKQTALIVLRFYLWHIQCGAETSTGISLRVAWWCYTATEAQATRAAGDPRVGGADWGDSPLSIRDLPYSSTPDNRWMAPICLSHLLRQKNGWWEGWEAEE